MSRIMGGRGRPPFEYLFMIPGLLLVLGGVLIFTAPMVLVWLIAGTAILLGVLIIFFAIFMRRAMTRRHDAAIAAHMPVGKTQAL